MPVEYVVLNQGALVLERWTGTISQEEVLAHERPEVRGPTPPEPPQLRASTSTIAAEVP